MGKMSRREKKMTKEALDRLEHSRKRDKMLQQDPTKSYKRKIVHTDMPWPLELIQMGRIDIVIMLMIIIAVIIIAFGYGIWLLFNWLMGVIG